MIEKEKPKTATELIREDEEASRVKKFAPRPLKDRATIKDEHNDAVNKGTPKTTAAWIINKPNPWFS
jgi:hypothetical protein